MGDDMHSTEQTPRFPTKLAGPGEQSGARSLVTAPDQDAAPYAVITADQAGRVLHFDAAAEHLFGYPPHEAAGQDLANLITPPAQRKEHNQELRGHLGTPGPAFVRRLQVLAFRADGGQFPAEVILLRLPAEGRAAFAVYVRDLTERMQAAAALRQSDERYRNLFENANDIIYAHDLAGNLTCWNRAGERILGYTVDEALGMNIAQLVAPEHLERARQMTTRKVVEGGRTTYELDVLAKDGRRVTVEINSRLADAPDQTPQVQGMARDITDRKRAEEALRDADRKKDEFLATLAHELRNPLAPLHNALEIMRLAPGNPEAMRRAQEMMGRQVQQMARLVDDLLDVSRITLGKLELRRERLDLSAVVLSAVETSRPLIEAARHALTLVPPPQPLAVEGDRTRLAQVLSNLLNNAAKYTPEGGRIYLILERDGQQAVVRVRDSGVGIPAGMLSTIFELFSQGDQSSHSAQGGLGIGLTLVRRLAELHGGSVEAHSDGSGKGSEFVVRLPLVGEPLAGQQRGAREDSAHEAVAGPAHRILVVDDNADSAESLAMMLRLLGHEVHTAHDGPTAVLAAATIAPDVVLLDIGLPGMDGYEVARQLRALPQVRGAVLVAQTGWGQEEDRRKSREAGFDHHLVKPVDPAALREVLDRHVSPVPQGHATGAEHSPQRTLSGCSRPNGS
jgi:PAS domain S-box-containing protein